MTTPRPQLPHFDRPESTVPHEQDFDQELYDALGLATRGFAPHSHDLVQRAALRGRQLRRIRQSQLALAAVLLIGTAGFGLNRFGPQLGSAPVSPAGQSTSAAPTTLAVVDTPTAMPVDSARLLELFGAKLPVGLELSEPFRADSVKDRAPGLRGAALVAAYTVRNGSGTGTVAITITRTSPAANRVADTATEVNGGYLTISEPARTADVPQVRSATMQWPDGEVKVIADNVPVPGSGRTGLYPNAPLLSAAELSALAVDPAWQRVAAGLPAP
ncbi:hypothetical protein [Kitasatospora sp. P5_F3]